MTAPDWGYWAPASLEAVLHAVAGRSDGDASGDASGGAQRNREFTHSAPFRNDNAVRVSAGDADDVQLFAALYAGDRSALDTIYRTTYADLWQFAFTYVRSPELADEVVQDVFMTVMTRNEVLPRAGTVRGYLFTAVRNRALNALRSARRTTAAQESLTHETLATDADRTFVPVDALATADERQRTVAHAVYALPDRQQRAVLLRYAAQLSFGEIAEALGISPDAARMLVNRATAELRERLTSVITALEE